MKTSRQRSEAWGVFEWTLLLKLVLGPVPASGAALGPAPLAAIVTNKRFVQASGHA